MLPSHDPNIPEGRAEFNVYQPDMIIPRGKEPLDTNSPDMIIPRRREALTNSGTEFNEFNLPSSGSIRSKPAMW